MSKDTKILNSFILVFYPHISSEEMADIAQSVHAVSYKEVTSESGDYYRLIALLRSTIETRMTLFLTGIQVETYAPLSFVMLALKKKPYYIFDLSTEIDLLSENVQIAWEDITSLIGLFNKLRGEIWSFDEDYRRYFMKSPNIFNNIDWDELRTKLEGEKQKVANEIKLILDDHKNELIGS